MGWSVGILSIGIHWHHYVSTFLKEKLYFGMVWDNEKCLSHSIILEGSWYLSGIRSDVNLDYLVKIVLPGFCTVKLLFFPFTILSPAQIQRLELEAKINLLEAGVIYYLEFFCKEDLSLLFQLLTFWKLQSLNCPLFIKGLLIGSITDMSRYEVLWKLQF